MGLKSNKFKQFNNLIKNKNFVKNLILMLVLYFISPNKKNLIQ